MAERIDWPKEAIEIINRSRSAEENNGYWDLQSPGFCYQGDAHEFVQQLIDADWRILELTGMATCLQNMVSYIDGGELSEYVLNKTPGRYYPDSKPAYVAPGFELVSKKARKTGLYTQVVESRLIRAVRVIHEGLFGIEIIGAPPIERKLAGFNRLETPEYILDAINSVTPRLVEQPRKPSWVEVRVHQLRNGKTTKQSQKS